MDAGFTGTQVGCKPPQVENLRRVVRALASLATGILTFHHGDCIGGDETLHGVVRELCDRVEPPRHEAQVTGPRDAASGVNQPSCFERRRSPPRERPDVRTAGHVEEEREPLVGHTGEVPRPRARPCVRPRIRSLAPRESNSVSTAHRPPPTARTAARPSRDA